MEEEFRYEYQESEKFATVVFPVLDKGRKDVDCWPEIRERLVSLGTVIYQRIDNSDL